MPIILVPLGQRVKIVAVQSHENVHGVPPAECDCGRYQVTRRSTTVP